MERVRGRRRSPSGAGIIEPNEQLNSRRFPVTVAQPPVMRCEICQRTVAYQPGTLSEALTEHYRRAHPEALGRPAWLGVIGICLDPPRRGSAELITLHDKLAYV